MILIIMHEHFGYHIMVDCSDIQCDIELLNNKDYLKSFIKDMLKATDMTAWGSPVLQRLTVDEGFPEHLSGYSIVQLIHTSSLTVHICDLSKTLYFDLFSCKSFKNEDVLDVIDLYFKPLHHKLNFITRQA